MALVTLTLTLIIEPIYLMWQKTLQLLLVVLSHNSLLPESQFDAEATQ